MSGLTLHFLDEETDAQRAEDHISDSYGTRSQIPSVPIRQSFHYAVRLIGVTFLTQKLLRWYAGKTQVSFRALSKCQLFHKAFVDGPGPNRTLHPPISLSIFLNHPCKAFVVWQLELIIQLELMMYMFYLSYWTTRDA